MILPEAESDLDSAFSWYEQQRPGLGSEFFDEVTVAFNRIRSHPLAYMEVEGAIRRAFTRRFPYAIYFELEAHIYVFAVLHQKQDSYRWRSRKGGL